jgi:hypothetical protein
MEVYVKVAVKSYRRLSGLGRGHVASTPCFLDLPNYYLRRD